MLRKDCIRSRGIKTATNPMNAVKEYKMHLTYTNQDQLCSSLIFSFIVCRVTESEMTNFGRKRNEIKLKTEGIFAKSEV